MTTRVVAATGNSHKLTELSALLGSLGAEVVSKTAAGVMASDPDETGASFEANALIKACAVFEDCGQATVADDSGLEVDAIQGAPGVYSARFCEMFFRGEISVGDGSGGLSPAEITRRSLWRERSGDAANNRLLLELLSDVPAEKRTARFVCAITFIEKGKEPIIVKGMCEGHIAEHTSGTGGFGYDPLFIPKEYASEGLTFAQLPEAAKNSISHRGRALTLLAEKLRAR